ERYQGFDTGDPKPVKLYLRLLGQTPAQQDYAKEMATLLTELSEGEQIDGPLVESTDELGYDLLRDVTYLLSDAQLSHTQLVMVDEFWEAEHTFLPLTRYLDQQPKDAPVDRFFGDGDRRAVFSKALKSLEILEDEAVISVHDDRIPYTWDFGFMLGRPDAWRS